MFDKAVRDFERLSPLHRKIILLLLSGLVKRGQELRHCDLLSRREIIELFDELHSVGRQRQTVEQRSDGNTNQI